MTTPIAVVIDQNGVWAPTFSDVLAWIQSQYRSIYGADIDIAPDTQDGQLLSIFADAINDQNMSCVAGFNSFRPSFAVGAGLSSIVKINGIRRQLATQSECTVTLGGIVGTVIENAYIEDNLNLNTVWFIFGPIIIPPAGVIDTVATCTTFGAIKADIGTLTNIMTPIPGWQTVINSVAATVGAPVETDAQLRRRQTKSTALPALTVLPSIQGNLLALPGVTRARVYQNDTFFVDANGIPSRSICCVVEGGDPQQIANTIAFTKTPGVPTYGSTSVETFDQMGMPNVINFFVLTEITCNVLVTATAAFGYTVAVATNIAEAVTSYLTLLDIGVTVFLGDLYSPANLDGDAAITGTGMSQLQLDPLGLTYSIDAPYGLAIARQDMIANSDYPAGVTSIAVPWSGYYHNGEAVWFALANGTFWQTFVTDASQGTYIVIAQPTPSAITHGAPIYGVGDIIVRFNEAAYAQLSNVKVNIH